MKPRIESEQQASIAAWQAFLDNMSRRKAFLGFPDFLDFSFLETGASAGRAVCCLFRKFSEVDINALLERMKKDSNLKVSAFRLFDLKENPNDFNNAEKLSEIRQKMIDHDPIPYGTGFLVGKNYLLTNHHVIQQQNDLAHFEAHFLYEKDPLGRNLKARALKAQDGRVIYKFKTDFFYPCRNSELDYVLLQLEDSPADPSQQDQLPFAAAGDNFSFLPLPNPELTQVIRSAISKDELLKLVEADAAKKAWLETFPEEEFLGEMVNIIQHSQGRPKEIVIFDNLMKAVYEDSLEYRTDTEPGSSGSPLLNQSWQLLGLHRGACLEPDPANPEMGRITSFVGVRASSIVQDMQEQCNQPDMGQDPVPLKQFLENWVTPQRKQIFLVAGRRDRSQILAPDDAATERRLMIQLRDAIRGEMIRQNPDPSHINVRINETDEGLDRVIQEVNEKSRPGDIAIEFAMNASDQPKPDELLLFYSHTKPHAKIDAQAFQQAIAQLEQASYQLSVDSDRRFGSLRFCRRVVIPSAVMFVGDLAEPDWVETNLPALAQQIARSILAWYAATLKR